MTRLEADRHPVESGRFDRTVGPQPGAPERLVSRSAAPEIAFFWVVFAYGALKAAAGRKRSRKKFAIVSPPRHLKKSLDFGNVWDRGPGRGRPRSGGTKAGEDRGKERRARKGGRSPQTLRDQGSDSFPARRASGPRAWKNGDAVRHPLGVRHIPILQIDKNTGIEISRSGPAA